LTTPKKDAEYADSAEKNLNDPRFPRPFFHFAENLTDMAKFILLT